MALIKGTILKKRPIVTPGPRPPKLYSTVYGTGHHCPETGWWEPAEKTGEALFISEGELMPAINGLPVVWKLSPDMAQRHFG